MFSIKDKIVIRITFKSLQSNNNAYQLHVNKNAN